MHRTKLYILSILALLAFSLLIINRSEERLEVKNASNQNMDHSGATGNTDNQLYSDSIVKQQNLPADQESISAKSDSKYTNPNNAQAKSENSNKVGRGTEKAARNHANSINSDHLGNSAGNQLFSPATRSFGAGSYEKIQIEKTDFKYPNIARVQKYVPDEDGSPTLSSERSYIADHLIVRLHPGKGAEELRDRLQRNGMRLKRKLASTDSYLVQFDVTSPEDMDRATRLLENETDLVAGTIPDEIITLSAAPNDPEYPKLWGLHNDGTDGSPDADIDAPEAWEYTTGSRDVVVAIIDSGLDPFHSDLKDNLWVNPNEVTGDANADGCPGVCNVDDDGDGLIDEDKLGCGRNGFDAEGIECVWANDLARDDDENGYADDVNGWDFYNDRSLIRDFDGHGTHVAGTIGAKGDNENGITGVNWEVSLQSLQFIGNGGRGTTSDAIEAVYYAINNGADIINASWGSRSDVPELFDAISAANDKSVLFVAAAGNGNLLGEALNNDRWPHFPSNYALRLPNVISVAATDHNDELATFSNYGHSAVQLAAPGVDIYSAQPYGGFRLLSGTSMAAPHVAGAAALLKAYRPDLDALMLKQLLLEGVDRKDHYTGKTLTGGRLNAHKSLELLARKRLVASITDIQDTTGGNGDRRAQSGESIQFNLNISVLQNQIGLEGARAELYAPRGTNSVQFIQNATYLAQPHGSNLAISTQPLELKFNESLDTPFLHLPLFLSIQTASGERFQSIVYIDAVQRYEVSGYVRVEGEGLVNIPIRTWRGDNLILAETDESGYYSFMANAGELAFHARNEELFARVQFLNLLEDTTLDFNFYRAFKGYVRDAKSGEALAHAQVRITGTLSEPAPFKELVADENGYYEYLDDVVITREYPTYIQAAVPGKYWSSKIAKHEIGPGTKVININLDRGGYAIVDYVDKLPDIGINDQIASAANASSDPFSLHTFRIPNGEEYFDLPFVWDKDSFSVPNLGNFSSLKGISPEGHITGNLIPDESDNSKSRAFIQRGNGVEILPNPDNIQRLFAYGISPEGKVFGSAEAENGSDGYFPFIWNKSESIILEKLGGKDAEVSDYNNGIAVGSVQREDRSYAPVYWEGTTLNELKPLHADMPYAIPSAVNANGHILGSSAFHVSSDYPDYWPALWINGEVITAPHPPGVYFFGIRGKDINDYGSYVSSVNSLNGTAYPMLTTPERGSMWLEDLVKHEGTYGTIIQKVRTINNRNEIFGTILKVREEEEEMNIYSRSVMLLPIEVPEANSHTVTLLEGAIARKSIASEAPENFEYTYHIINKPAHGRVRLNASSGELVYAPLPGFTGSDQLTYIIKVNDQVDSYPAVVNFKVLPLEETITRRVRAYDGQTSRWALSRYLSADFKESSFSFTLIRKPRNGRFRFSTSTGTFVYIPYTGFSGTDRLYVQAKNANGQTVNLMLYVYVR